MFECPRSEEEAVSLGLLSPKGQLVVARVRESGEVSGFKDFSLRGRQGASLGPRKDCG